ncbi:MAG TPA: FGGY family carbohydrate kinase [Acidimicrobiales bacterium]|nr:FGGY family carbohydrate kinase [Acidimicrobiales bacterium]
MTTEELLVGIDLGSTGTKVTLLRAGTGVLASVAAPSPLYSEGPGQSEADTAIWWSNVGALVPRVAAAAGVSPGEIAAVATTGMVPAVVLLDGDGVPLRRAILQNDARAVVEIGEVATELEERGFDALAHTGSALTQQSVAPLWRWLLRHEPEVAARTHALVGSYDWLAIALGAELHVEANWALESGLYELSDGRAEPVIAAGGLRAEICPPIRRSGELAGTLSEAAAAATSLRAGIPIYVGGADHVLAAYAAGLASPGDWLVKLGGAGDILVVTDTAVLDARLYLDAHPAPGLWLPNGCMATSGSLLRWAQELFGGTPLEELDADAAAAPAAAVICLPYFLGEKSPLHDPDLRGAFVGLQLGHGRGEIFRACMEAVAYGFRNHVEVLSDAGITLGRARVSNGGSGSRVWKQIVADVLGRPLSPVVEHGGAALGAALVAGVGSGVLSDWSAASDYARLGDEITPREEHHDLYEEGYEMYLELQRTLTPVSHRLARRGRT